MKMKRKILYDMGEVLIKLLLNIVIGCTSPRAHAVLTQMRRNSFYIVRVTNLQQKIKV
jgi:hypothetical protein